MTFTSKILLSSLVLSALASTAMATEYPVELVTKQNHVLKVATNTPLTKKFSLPSDQRQMLNSVNELLALADQQEAEEQAEEKAKEKVKDQKKAFSIPRPRFKFELNDDDLIVGLKEMRKRLRKSDLSKTDIYWIMEIAEAINSNFRYPVPDDVGLSEGLRGVLGRRPFGKNPGKDAVNLSNRSASDLSTVDPKATSFWHRPLAIEKTNLAAGFGRKTAPDYSKTIFKYHKAKDGFGIHAGFRVKDGDVKYKIRLESEVRSGPFNSRVVDALGFHTYPLDHLPKLHVGYDRKLLTEFNSRQSLQSVLEVWNIDILKIELQTKIDPFQFILRAQLTNGQWIPGGEALKARLLKNLKGEAPQEEKSNFNESFESQIAVLEIGPASIQRLEEDAYSVGSWDYNHWAHQDRRELRGFALLAGWLGIYDARWENTRVELVGKNGNYEIRHLISDVGSGLGRASSVLNYSNSDVKQFPWIFVLKKGRSEPSLTTDNYSVIMENKAFEKMNWDDARWMARLIGQLRSEQICQALKASGFNQAEREIMAQKLAVRRDHLLQEVGLHNENPNYAFLIRGGAQIEKDPQTKKTTRLDRGTVLCGN